MFEDFTAFFIKIDNADPMLLYLDQTPVKYLHTSCIFSPCHGACGMSNSLISSHFTPHKTDVWSGQQQISERQKKTIEVDLPIFNPQMYLFLSSDRLLECFPLAIGSVATHYVVRETTQIYKTMISLDSYISFAATTIKILETKLERFSYVCHVGGAK